MDWEHDYGFRQVAKLVWPHDFRIADSYRREAGRADARRRLRNRHEGYRASIALAKLQDEVSTVREQLMYRAGVA